MYHVAVPADKFPFIAISTKVMQDHGSCSSAHAQEGVPPFTSTLQRILNLSQNKKMQWKHNNLDLLKKKSWQFYTFKSIWEFWEIGIYQRNISLLPLISRLNYFFSLSQLWQLLWCHVDSKWLNKRKYGFRPKKCESAVPFMPSLIFWEELTFEQHDLNCMGPLKCRLFSQ